MQPFVSAIEGEVTFARSLGKIDEEILQQAKEEGLGEMVNEKTLDSTGWTQYAAHLEDFKNAYEQSSVADKQVMANIIYLCAAKAPGYRIEQSIYDEMVKYERELFKKDPNSSGLKNLRQDLNEIENANISHGLIIQERDSLEIPVTEANYQQMIIAETNLFNIDHRNSIEERAYLNLMMAINKFENNAPGDFNVQSFRPAADRYGIDLEVSEEEVRDNFLAPPSFSSPIDVQNRDQLEPLTPGIAEKLTVANAEADATIATPQIKVGGPGKGM